MGYRYAHTTEKLGLVEGGGKDTLTEAPALTTLAALLLTSVAPLGRAPGPSAR
jgi:hypothetical protein